VGLVTGLRTQHARFLRGGESSRGKLCQASSSRRRSRKRSSVRRGVFVVLIAAARSSAIQIGKYASVPSGWRTIRATS
jgi:hypothetical protein